MFFAGIFVINSGQFGQAIGVISFLLWILFMMVTVVSLVNDDRTKYYLTNSRIITRRNQLLVPELAGARVEQSWLGRLRGTGNVYFNSKDGRWAVFKHVKNPEEIRQSGMSLSGATATPTTMICNYCGSRIPVGAAKCLTCGAEV